VTSGSPTPHPTPGMCGDQMPMVLRGGAHAVCELRHGHPGWHETTDGAKWSPRRAPVPVGESRIATGGSAAAEPAGDGLDDLRAERDALADLIDPVDRTNPQGRRTGLSPLADAYSAADRILGAGFRRVPEDAERLGAELADLRYGLALRACTAPDADIDTMLGSLDARLRDALAVDPKEVQS
jgi:hypothetical protein